MEKHFVVSGYGVRDGKVLLVHHRKLGMWLPVGGHVEKNELPEEALIREFREETGLDVEILGKKDSRGDCEEVRVLHAPHHVQLEYITDRQGDHYHIDLVYFCKVRKGKEKLEAHAHRGIRWFSKSDMRKEKLQGNVRHFAAMAIDSLAKVK